MYQHQDWQGQPISLPLGKVVCIGQNYQDHIAEMQSKTAPEALFLSNRRLRWCRWRQLLVFRQDAVTFTMSWSWRY